MLGGETNWICEIKKKEGKFLDWVLFKGPIETLENSSKYIEPAYEVTTEYESKPINNADVKETGSLTFARNWEFGESVIYPNILVPPNLIENDHIFEIFGL